jgi:hypothetical protein
MRETWLSRWVPSGLAAGAAGVASVAFAAHAWQAMSGAYLSYVGGIWLALGRDLASGVFFRDLSGPLGYGGTRYFPLFFTIIGGFLALGVPPLAAGWAASAIGGVVLATGLARVVRALGAPPRMLWLAAAGALAPYFVQQTLFEVRADVLAAGLNLWGLAAVIPLWREGPGPGSVGRDVRPGGVRVWTAAAWFTLALSAKITSLAVPGCVVVALVLSRRTRTAVRLGTGMGIGALAFLGVVEAASAGRAVRSWQACMFADTGGGQTIQRLLAGNFIALARFSHLLTALLGLTGLALLAAVALEWRGRAHEGSVGRGRAFAGRALWLPLVLFGGVTASTALTLSSPGTVPSNQVVEWLGVAFAVLAWTAAARPELRRIVSTGLALLVVWMSIQDGVRVRQLWQGQATRASAAVRQQVAGLVAHARAPVLAESALWPVLAGQSPFLLDPFALRVVTLTHPEIGRDVEARLDARFFSSVILEMDPTSLHGRGFYEYVHFGWPIMSRILANYRVDSHPASDVWIYVPRAHDAR